MLKGAFNSVGKQKITEKKLTQYFFDVPSKFLSSPHLVHEAERIVTQNALEPNNRTTKISSKADVRSAVSEFPCYLKYGCFPTNMSDENTSQECVHLRHTWHILDKEKQEEV